MHPCSFNPPVAATKYSSTSGKGTEPEPHPKKKKTEQNRTEQNCTTTTNTQRTITKLNKANEKAFWYVRRNQIADRPTHPDRPPADFLLV
jgi:hypothetical protein